MPRACTVILSATAIDFAKIFCGRPLPVHKDFFFE
jgi:hypothetical protein